MPHSRLSSEEISRRGEEIYQNELRSKIEAGNIGKLVSIDVETGDYEIGSDSFGDLDAPLRLHAKHADAAIYTLRIGYNAVVALGGILERTV
jgi:hypothetical protein